MGTPDTAAPETGLFLCEGGSVIEMDLPLAEGIAERVTKGYIKQVNPDGTDYTEPVAADDLTPAAPVRPAQAASKAEWVGWAVNHPDESRRMTAEDADALNKNELIERVGKD